MITMNLTYDKSHNYFGYYLITEEEVQRLVAAANEGEVLVFEDERICARLEEGTLYLSGNIVSPFFATHIKDYYGQERVDYANDMTRPVKALVKHAVIADGVKNVFDFFVDYPNLTKVTLPDSVERLSCAFAKCPKLKAYPLPASLVSLCGEYCGIISDEVVLPENLEEIERDSYPAYYHDSYPFAHSNVRSVIFPKNMKVIPSSSFKSCKYLENLVIPEGVEEIDSSAFSNCPSLKSVTLPSTIKEIGSYAFSQCKSLEKINLPSGCYVSETAFLGCPCERNIQRMRMVSESHTEYTEDMGEIGDYEAIKAALCGKSLWEQFDYFTLSDHSDTVTYSYGDKDSESASSNESSLFPTSDVEELILKDGIIVGVSVKSCVILAGQTVCTYSATEEDGTGSRSVDEYFTLRFIPKKN